MLSSVMGWRSLGGDGVSDTSTLHAVDDRTALAIPGRRVVNRDRRSNRRLSLPGPSLGTCSRKRRQSLDASVRMAAFDP
jgi:hypothetical protein